MRAERCSVTVLSLHAPTQGQYWLFLGVAQQDNDFWTVISPCCRIILSDYPNADVAAMDYDLLCALFKHPIT